MFISSLDQKRQCRQHVASIRRLKPCRTEEGSLKCMVDWHCCQHHSQPEPTWNFQPVYLPSSRLCRNRDGDKEALGQATLFLPAVGDADLRIALPPALSITATHHGSLDCRLQLLGITADWPATKQQQQQQPQLHPARSPAAGFAVRCGSLLLSQVLFPDHTHRLLTYLAAPVAVADVVQVLTAAVPAAAKQAIRHKARGMKQRLQPWGQPKHRDPCVDAGASGSGLGAMQAASGLVTASMHVLRNLSGPSAALACAGWLWCVLHPPSITLCSGLVALMAAAADYQQLGRDISRGKHQAAGQHVETLWHVRHKRAAQRLAPYCNDLPRQPPLKPVIHLARCCSIAAGVLVQGQALCGAVASPDTSDNWLTGYQGMQGTADAQQQQQQLVMSCSFVPPAYAAEKGKQHAAAGLDRAQLLELFTGYNTDGGQQSRALLECKADSKSVSALFPDTVIGRQDSSRQLASSHFVPGSCDSLRTPAVRPCDIDSSSSPGQISDQNSSGGELQHQGLLKSSQPQQQQEKLEQQRQLSLELLQLPVVHCCPSAASTPSPLSAVVMGSTECVTSKFAQAAPSQCWTHSSSGVGSSSTTDPLGFLDSLPLFGRDDHHQGSVSGMCSRSYGGLRDHLLLCVRGVQLLLLFSPFVLLGVPMLLLAWYLMTRAQQQQQQQTQTSEGERRKQQDACNSSIECSIKTSRRFRVAGDEPVIRGDEDYDDISRSISGSIRLQRTAAEVLHHISHPSAMLHQLLQQLLLLLSMLCAVLDVLVVLLLGGYWASGRDVWLSAGLWLRGRCWQLLLLSCRWSGAAFIKWAQWSSSRRDIFPADFCDTLAELHDRAPTHRFHHTRREVEAAFGVPLHQLFDSFDHEALACGSVAQVHRAKLRKRHALAAMAAAAAARHSSKNQQSVVTRNSRWFKALNSNFSNDSLLPQHTAASDHGCDPDPADPAVDVIVKVCHPGVADQISRDFRLLSGLSAAAARLPALRGLSLRESVSQFSHTMTAQTDLRVEATHALRFHNNFASVKSSVAIPKSIPGLVHERVLVETFEAGDSVATFMKTPSPLNSQIVALGVDTYLKMLLVDNFVHTDLHPGNILVRAVHRGGKAGHKKQQQQKEMARSNRTCSGQQHQRNQHQQQRSWWQCWSERYGTTDKGTSAASYAVGAAADSGSCTAGAAAERWELDLQQMAEHQRSKWSSVHANAISSSTLQQDDVVNNCAAQYSAKHIGQQIGDTRDDADVCAQLVLLDFGLAEELTPEVRFHFIRFLTAISAGNGLAAAHHLLQWSHHQTCVDRSAFTADIMDLFEQQCDIRSDAGIDLDAVIKAVLVLARKHHVSIDSCYASLVLSVCVLVGFAKALDPGVNLMDAATPALLTYALTGEVVGRLYSS